MLPAASAPDQEYAQIWCESTARVLESLQKAPFPGSCHPAAVQSDLPAADDSLLIAFKISGCLEGEQSFQVSKSDAVRLAQLLMAEPMDASVPFADVHSDALSEIFRQFAGMAATSCEAKYGGAVQFQLETGGSPAWKGAGYAVAVFAAPKVSPIQWTVGLSPELHAVLAVLDAAREAKPSAPAVSAPSASSAPSKAPAPVAGSPAVPPPKSSGPVLLSPPPPASSDPSESPANLNLLLDIELDASLRFGQREMMLRDILDLRPGSVVELDRQIQEPAELLVAGRVVARGEVVIVDGNYGLRITDIEQPHQRLRALDA